MLVDKTKFESEFNVSRETIERLETYQSLLTKWNPRINLVSKTTISDIWHRHFADSTQVWAQVPDTCEHWLDFGSGAGFPGLVGAVLAKEKSPRLKVHLVESDQRKCAFLLTVARELELSVEVSPIRIEALTRQKSDVISARALAPLSQLLDLSYPHAHKSTVLLFPKGNTYESELTIAQNHWHMDIEAIPSMTDSGSVILRIEDFHRANP